MGRFSKSVFGKEKLPERCLVYLGAYIPERKESIRNFFDEWSRIKDNCIKYSFAVKDDKEYLLVFNVYGGAMILELLHLLKDGCVNKVFCIGSMGGKNLPVGTLVLPTSVIDRAGIVLVDDPTKEIVKPDQDSLKSVEKVLQYSGENYVEGEIVSEPCVFHNISHIKNLIEQRKSVIGDECEMSTFYYFSQKEGLRGYALLYVSDNKSYDIISREEEVREARKKALKAITRIAIETLS